ncbi:hypothetical protein ACFV9C_25295 [Kribbella sp. NPDC059898]|uniref:glycine-rich domain-containing protein n=1 Tax=Kribbella sp. NPDC059898 TaxID=3346995 RepID=UPI00365DBBAE
MPNTPMQGFPYPALSDAANGPVAFQNLAQAVEKRVVMVYADAASRTAAVPAPTAGMLSFLTTTGVFEWYTGTAWVALRPLTNSTFTQSIAGSANFVKPTGPAARLHIVELWGPGGAGGGCVGAGSGTAEGGGGGAGGYVRRVYADSELSASEPFLIGAGGTGVSGNNGNPGSASSTFKALTAGAGAGGSVMTSGTTDAGANGGQGGTGSGGQLNAQGSDGGKGRRLGSTCLFANHGGAAPVGGGAVMFPNFGAGTGTAGNSPGGGGSGGFASTANVAGGAGAPGKILVTSLY